MQTPIYKFANFGNISFQGSQFHDKMLFSMSVTSLMLLVPCIYIIFILIKSILDPLRLVPGPLLARYTRLWYLYKIYQGDFEKTNIELHKRFGPVVRIAPNEYSINDVSAAKTIYGHGNAFIKVFRLQFCAA